MMIREAPNRPSSNFDQYLQLFSKNLASTDKFVYLISNQDNDDNPYDLMVIDFHILKKLNPKEYYTMSMHGLCHYVNGKPLEFISLAYWQKEREAYDKNVGLTLRIHYNNERYWILNAPLDYMSLRQSIRAAFENDLPKDWTLQYSDTDGELIFLSNDEDFQEMIEDMLENSPIVKIYVRPVEELVLKDLQPEAEEKVEKKEEEDLSNSFEKLMENKEMDVDVDVFDIYNSGDSSISFSKVSESDEGKPKADIISLSGSFEKLEKELSLDQELGKLSKKSLSVDMETEKEDIVKENVGDILDLDTLIIPVVNYCQEERSIHEDATCNGCGVSPIVGVRYNCPICKDVDYCEECEEMFEHPHPFFKIKNANHSPKDVVSLIVAENIIEAEGLSKNMKEEMALIVNFLREKLLGTTEPEVREDLEEEKEDREVNLLREKLFGTTEPEVREDPEEEKEPIEEVKEGENLDKSFSSDIQEWKIEITKYPQTVYDLAKEVLEIFPDANLNGLLDFINRSPELTLDEIIENFLIL